MNASSRDQGRPKVSVVIPTLNAANHLPSLFSSLKRQEPHPPEEIVVIDSGSSDASCRIAREEADILLSLHPFTHGRARNKGAEVASGDIVVFLSQDALPEREWLAQLIAPFADPSIAAVYSRQVARANAPFTERFFLEMRYPKGGIIHRRKTPGMELTLENTFFSNVSSAIRRSVLQRIPFDENLIMSEDQQFSKDALLAGHTIAYAPDSVVIHSHCYSLNTVFGRYFDSVYSLRQIFPTHSLKTTSSLGSRYLGKEALYVVINHPVQIPYYLCYSAVKTCAILLAHCADILPRRLLRHCSFHKAHWDR